MNKVVIPILLMFITSCGGDYAVEEEQRQTNEAQISLDRINNLHIQQGLTTSNQNEFMLPASVANLAGKVFINNDGYGSSLKFHWVVKDRILVCDTAFSSMQGKIGQRSLYWFNKAEKTLYVTQYGKDIPLQYKGNNLYSYINTATSTFAALEIYPNKVGTEVGYFELSTSQEVESSVRRYAQNEQQENQIALSSAIGNLQKGMSEEFASQQQSELERQQMLNNIAHRAREAEKENQEKSRNQYTPNTQRQSTTRADISKANPKPDATSKDSSNSAQLAKNDTQNINKEKSSKSKDVSNSEFKTKSTSNVIANKTKALIKYPEAIMVCTKPTAPKGKFQCSSPINIQEGRSDDISGYQTPGQMVNNNTEACPELRRLNSTTHLVWGCGFAATGANNALDRSSGVNVQGRKTYYCTDKEFSCRNTSPN